MRPPDILCIGAALWDLVGRSDHPLGDGADGPGTVTRAPGGVALNIAVALARHGLRPALLSAVGDDAEGHELLSRLDGTGVLTDHVARLRGRPTGRYLAIEVEGRLAAAICDAATVETSGDALIAPLRDGRLGSAAEPWAGTVVFDGNLDRALVATLPHDPAFAAADLWLVSASGLKAPLIAPLLRHPRATICVNRVEAEALVGAPCPDAAVAAAALLRRGATRAIVTDGSLAAADASAGALHTGSPPPVRVARVTGAGDSFLAALLAAERSGTPRGPSLRAALAAAARHVSGQDDP